MFEFPLSAGARIGMYGYPPGTVFGGEYRYDHLRVLEPLSCTTTHPAGLAGPNLRRILNVLRSGCTQDHLEAIFEDIPEQLQP